ncbi:hypothetical protein P3102_34665 [Amycolatopsis sp. QT-25]|uniref:hypothetical protein n=1 Tax=Amycolatopsis sp. QT-25 TaxID=3034022 RepID=UPI0023ED7E5C|nr:hypothetical protein [Amycolatopsis sp. QT-25]WET79117.1 hypothetical protein P3102_34665 [Amycolatopsis sp. QT-25]
MAKLQVDAERRPRVNPPRPKAPLSRRQDTLPAVVRWMTRKRPADADRGRGFTTRHLGAEDGER